MVGAIAEKPIIKKHISIKHRKKTPAHYLDILYEQTHNLLYLKQYYHLREDVFTEVWGLENYSGEEDEYDKSSDIIIARKGKKCIGGARITVSTPENPVLLPMEGDDFLLKNALKDLNLGNARYGEYSRLVLLPEYWHEGTFGLYKKLTNRSIDLGLDYIFAIGPMQHIRKARLIHHKLGLNVELIDVNFPQRECYEGIKMFFAMLDLTHLKKDSDLRRELRFRMKLVTQE